MWTKIIAGVFILSGVALAARPERLRRKLQRKGKRYIRRVLFAAVLSGGALLVPIGWQYSGLLPKALTAVGGILILKAAFLLKSKSAELMADRLMRVPALYMRLFAVGQVALGIVILILQNREVSG